MSQSEGLKERQYGEWLKAGGVLRSGGEKGKVFNGMSSSHMKEDDIRIKATGTVVNFSSSTQSEYDKNVGWNNNDEEVMTKVLNSETLTKNSNSSFPTRGSLQGRDKAMETSRGLGLHQETRNKENET